MKNVFKLDNGELVEVSLSVINKGDKFRLERDGQEYVADGSPYVKNGKMGVDVQTDNSFWKIARKYDLERKLRELGRNLAIQGELIGEGIQSNPEKIKGQDLFVFDVFDIDTGNYLASDERLDITAELGLNDVPVIGYQNLTNETVESFLKSAEGVSLLNGGANKVREGLVFKSTQSQFSFKAISNAYLLGEK